METRSFNTSIQGDSNKLYGYCALWNVPTTISERGKTFIETIKPGAFTRSLQAKNDIVCTYNHNNDFPLGRTSNNSLVVREDDKGLFFEVTLPDTTVGRDLRTLTQLGTVAGASYKFSVPKGGETWNGNQRSLNNVDLYELGPVLTPATPETHVGLRSINFDLALLFREKIEPKI